MSDLQRNLWDETCRERVGEPSAPMETSVDFVVVGGGFTGCSAALHAAREGAKVVLLEAKSIGFGGSGRNVGLVNAGLWTPPEDVERTLGREEASRLYNLLAGAPDLVFDLIRQYDIDCDPVRAGTLHCAHSRTGLKDLKSREAQLRMRDAPVQLLDAQETARRIGCSRYHGALFDPRAGTIQPKAYCVGLARAARENGACILENAPVERVWKEAGYWVVQGGRHTVRAKCLLVATNAYQTGLDGISRSQFTPLHYFQLATRPLGSNLRRTILAGGEGCWDTATIMSSFRLDGEGRLLIGGIGALGQGAAFAHRDWAARKLAGLFPQASDVPLEYAWHGRIAMTDDHLPKILKLGNSGFSVFGYSGRGIGPGTAFGKAVALALLRGDEGLLPIAPSAHHAERFTRGRQTFYEIGAALYHLIDRR